MTKIIKKERNVIPMRGEVSIRAWKNVRTHKQLAELSGLAGKGDVATLKEAFGFYKKNLILIEGELITATNLLFSNYSIDYIALGSGGVSPDDNLIPVPPDRTDTALENEQFRIEIPVTAKEVLEDPSGLRVTATALSTDYPTVLTISEAALATNATAPSSSDRRDLVSRITFASIPFAALSVGLSITWAIFFDSAS